MVVIITGSASNASSKVLPKGYIGDQGLARDGMLPLDKDGLSSMSVAATAASGAKPADFSKDFGSIVAKNGRAGFAGGIGARGLDVHESTGNNTQAGAGGTGTTGGAGMAGGTATNGLILGDLNSNAKTYSTSTPAQ